MEIWLSWQNERERHQIPVLPSSFNVEVEQRNQTININEIGDIKLIGKTGLKSMNVSSFFPKQDYPFVTTQERHDPYVYVESIERWRLSGKPIRLLITDTPINLAMSIDRFDYEEKDGSGDVYYNLELSEYVFTNIKKTNKEYKEPATDNKKASKRETKEVAKTYTVKAGDTLSIIAKKTTGNSANYKKIAEKNNIKNPNIIKVGQVLKL